MGQLFQHSGKSLHCWALTIEESPLSGAVSVTHRLQSGVAGTIFPFLCWLTVTHTLPCVTTAPTSCLALVMVVVEFGEFLL
ncbi:hypothetical protein ACOMHN_054007 [Nucella lapillus]